MVRIPPGFTTRCPDVVAGGALAYLDLTQNVLGAKYVGVHAGADGVVFNAHVRFGDTTIMVSDTKGEREPSKLQFYFSV